MTRLATFPSLLRHSCWRRALLLGLGVLISLYSFYVLCFVPSVPDLGIRSLFDTTVKGTIRQLEAPEGATARQGDYITQVGDRPIRVWPELMQSPSALDKRRDEIEAQARAGHIDWAKVLPDERLLIKVQLQRQGTGEPFSVWCELGRLHVDELYPSLLWFFLKGFLFTVGALVFWKRPNDAAAAVFLFLCVVTLGAYMGGYHWNHITTRPELLVVFMACGVLLPAASLHFYLLFPERKPWFARRPWQTLLVVYGVPAAVFLLLLGCYLAVRASLGGELVTIRENLERLRVSIYVSFAVSCLWYLGCVASLVHSFRTVTDVTARNQVKCLLAGMVVSCVFVLASLYMIVFDPDAFAKGQATWPMFLASASINLAFVVSITRYRLMELDKILSSGMAYFLVTGLAVLVYYAVVFAGTLVFNQVLAGPTVAEALAVSTTFLVLLLALDLARSRVLRALDRRFSRNKSQLDHTLKQMSEAVAQLVDPPALAQRLLHSAADLLGVAQGAVYLRQGEPPIFRLAGHVGGPPPLDELALGFPLVEAVQSGQPLYRSAARGPYATSPAQRQLQFLGGELAQPLVHEGRLLALLVLGPKDVPYRPEDVNLLSALAQITVLALESAAGHRTIERLNHELQDKVEKIAEQQRRILTLQTQLHQRVDVPADRPAAARAEPAPEAPAPEPPAGIVGSGPVVRDLLGLVRKVAATDAVVLVRGESGTGKELLARAVHETSTRADKPFVKVHCAALSANLLESELFGHVKGAFTGAHRDKVGRFELAHGGTLFLDEIGDISLEVQTKLLRVLQERTFERVGSSEPVRVDVRIIAATHQDLEALIRQGRFREDLFYRLNVFPVRVPPLRERAEDVPELATSFVSRFADRFRKHVKLIDDDALAALKSYHWPGNIRQLENVIERAVVICEGPIVTTAELPAELLGGVGEEAEVVIAPATNGNGVHKPVSAPTNWRLERERTEREQLVRAMAAAQGNKAEAARALGVARSTLVSRLKKLGLS